MKIIVQMENRSGFFNQSLQRQLINNKDFSERYHLEVFNLEKLRKKYAEECKKRGISTLSRKIKLWGFNQFLEEEYKDFEGEIINIQYVTWRHVLILPFIKKHFQRIVLSFWGSDILRANRRILIIEKILFDNAEIITFVSKDMIKRFKEVFGEKYSTKIRKADFGSEIINHIDDVKNDDIVSFREKYNISNTKYCLVVGYNRDEAQQHIEIIRSIKNCNLNPGEIFLIFPWTYGSVSTEYKNKIENLINGIYEYAFLTEKLTDKEVACLRKITDIMIQIQTTDALSSSMLETLYAEKEVITGKWLNYEELDHAGVHLYYINTVNEVGSAIKRLMTNPLSNEAKRHNKEIIRKMCSWEYRINDWLDIYLSGKKP